MENLGFNVYAIDFDGTICKSEWPGLGPANEDVIRYIKRIQSYGNKIILWTCRTGKMLEDAVNFCREHGLYFDAVNENLPECIELYGGDSRKICADVYIDDKSVTELQVEGFEMLWLTLSASDCRGEKRKGDGDES